MTTVVVSCDSSHDDTSRVSWRHPVATTPGPSWGDTTVVTTVRGVSRRRASRRRPGCRDDGCRDVGRGCRGDTTVATTPGPSWGHYRRDDGRSVTETCVATTPRVSRMAYKLQVTENGRLQLQLNYNALYYTWQSTAPWHKPQAVRATGGNQRTVPAHRRNIVNEI